MSTEQTLLINSDSSGQTEKIAEQLGKVLQGGEVIELASDLGGGKTTFTRGLARGIGSSDHVSSPTFKILNEYQGKKLHLYHYDFYRLHDDQLIEHELYDALQDPNGVTVIEWGKRVGSALPEQRVVVRLHQDGETARKIEFHIPENKAYLAKELA